MSHLIEASRPLMRARNNSVTRSFSIAIPARKAGEVLWSPKPRGFLAEVDSIPRREPSPGNRYSYTRMQEAEKLGFLKRKMAEQRLQLDEMDRHLQYLARGQATKN
ncbi:ATPase inhibitor [Aspergillus melleus]|uniref:ATPase inhibitor n=1 Tax=Aspergillus melleus TaxID=138277 RepID=A0ACC3AML6_9EURO|nr:ATPase inhibitor [Aspergillus melleus]